MRSSPQDIDQKKRAVTLKSEDGKETVTLEVSPEVKNLAQVKKGDTVTVEHVESLGIEVFAMGQAPSAKAATRYVEVAKPGEKLRRVEVNVVELVATIDAIDYKARTATLTGPEGKTRTIKVGPEAKRFDNAKKGDEVLIQIMTATAVSVEKVEKKKWVT